MNKRISFLICFVAGLLLRSPAQDSLYTRQVLKTLCSEKYYGRGYLKSGLQKAEKFLVSEIKQQGAQPLFGKNYLQEFHHTVNTFPSTADISINHQKLECGSDFIPGADNPGLKGTCRLEKKDSVTFTGQIAGTPVVVKLRDKLTYTVGRKVSNNFVVELDRKKFTEVPGEISIRLRNKFESDFVSANVGCYLPGSSTSDSMIVFTAHFDHLGGIGRHTFFPGANDNASGVSMVLNLLRYYQSHPPKYKTVFVFFAGEEAGLLGSEYFVKNSPVDLGKIKFLVNLDLLGTGEEGIMVVNGAIYEKEFRQLENINADKTLLPQVRKRGKAANSDHYWFSEQGVPAFFIYTMGGIKAYHDVYDREQTLPLTYYKQVFQLLTKFIALQ